MTRVVIVGRGGYFDETETLYGLYFFKLLFVFILRGKLTFRFFFWRIPVPVELVAVR